MTERRSRLAIVSTMTGSPWGGSEELWAATARAANGAGWDVMASVADASSDQHDALRDRGIDVHQHFLPMSWSARLQHAAARAVSPLRKVVGFRPDVVLLSQGSTYEVCGNEALFGALTTGPLSAVPLIVLCQANWEERPDATPRRRADALFGRANAVLFVAERNLRQARRHLTSDLPNGQVVRNPVNVARFDAVPPHSDKSGCRLACVARLDTRFKGQDLMLEALALDLWKERDWHLGVYGRGPDEGYLRELVLYYGLGKNVSFNGHVADVRAIWEAEEVLVLPSHVEGTPLALVEAMICGRPVVATRVAGNDEWIEEGTSGFLAEAASVDSVGAALERAWAARESWEEMGLAARDKALTMIDRDPGATMLGIVSSAVHARSNPAAGTDGLRESVP